MSYTLYGNKGSGSFAVEAALALSGAAYDLIEIDTRSEEQLGPAFSALNPMRQVPALRLPDGTTMTESAAIVIHDAAAHPEKGLAPSAGTSAHAHFLRAMVFMSVNLYEGDLRYFYPERYTANAAGVAGVKAAGAAHMKKSFAVIEAMIGDRPYLCGDAFSVADPYLAMLTEWSPAPIAVARIGAIVAAVKAHPTIAPLWRKHGFKP